MLTKRASPAAVTMSACDLMMPAKMHYAHAQGKCDLHSSSRYADSMTEKHERLRKAREKAGYASARSAAEAMGAAVATYSQHENGTRGFPIKTAERYAAFFKVPVEWLTLGIQHNDPDSFIQLGPRLYVKGEVAAGVWKEAWEFDADDWEVFTGRADIAAPIRTRFGLRVKGDSMNLIYPPGSIVECVAYDDRTIENGRRVIVRQQRQDGRLETTVKELVTDQEGVVWLVPRSTNPAFQAPIRMDRPDPDVEKIEIIGIVVSSIRPE